MKVFKHNLIWTILLFSTMVFGQKKTTTTTTVSKVFSVNKDVVVDINTRHIDVKVTTWNQNKVSVEGTWSVEGMTEEQGNKFLKSWDFNAGGDKNKIIISSKINNELYSNGAIFEDFDFDFDSHMDIDLDMDAMMHDVGAFHIDIYDQMPHMQPLPPLPPMPPFPTPIMGHVNAIQFDYEEYEKDKEGYMKDFEKRQEAWEKEYEEKIAPQMEAYEKEIEAWEKKMEPKYKEYEKKMKEWEKKMEPKMKEYEKKMELQEKKMEEKMKIMEMKMEKNYEQRIRKKSSSLSKKYKIKKNLIIKVPKGATLKVDARYGTIELPDNIKMGK